MESFVKNLSKDDDKLEEKIVLNAFGMKIIENSKLSYPIAIARIKTTLTKYIISTVQK